jgi:rare lipoprotein A
MYGPVRTKLRRLVAILVMLVPVPVVDNAVAQTRQEGVASFYSDKFHGKRTASGEVYDKEGLTAAHKKLPFRTKVKVTHARNGKSVVVTINDRMAASSPVVIDVSRRAAERLGFVKAGRARVKLEVQK